MTRKQFLEKFIKNNIGEQTFFNRNIAGDKMVVKKRFKGITIEYCYDYEYYEIFGLTQEEKELFELGVMFKIK